MTHGRNKTVTNLEICVWIDIDDLKPVALKLSNRISQSLVI
jgi:hypothetical protein